MDMIRAAVIGTGFIGPAHVEALRRLGIEVVGIAGSSRSERAPKRRLSTSARCMTTGKS